MFKKTKVRSILELLGKDLSGRDRIMAIPGINFQLNTLLYQTFYN